MQLWHDGSIRVYVPDEFGATEPHPNIDGEFIFVNEQDEQVQDLIDDLVTLGFEALVSSLREKLNPYGVSIDYIISGMTNWNTDKVGVPNA